MTPLAEWMESRFEPEPNSGCWIWTGPRDSHGYGSAQQPDGRKRGAHVVMYELTRGPVPVGLVLDHLCRTPACVNPAHLEPVTQRVNTLRGIGPAARRAAQTACIHGHPFDAENTRVKLTGHGRRDCRTCNRRRGVLRWANLKRQP